MARAVIQARVVCRPVAGRAGRTEMIAARRPMPMAQRMTWRVSRSYWGQPFRIDIFKLADKKINPKGLTPI